MEDRSRVVVDRPTHTEEELTKEFDISYENLQKPPLRQRLKDEVSDICDCSKERITFFFSCLFPIFKWIREYQKEWIPGDIVSGLTVGVVHIPQSLAFSLLAGLAPVFGLYTSFYPVLIYTLMGTSRHISVGTFAVTSLLTRSVVLRHFPDELLRNETDIINAGTVASMTTESATADFPANELELKRAGVAAALMLLMGIFQLLFGIFRLGLITSYLSEPVIQGFTTGAACQVVTSQFPNILGIKIKAFNGPFALIFSWIEIFKNVPNIHVATLVITIICVIFLTVGREINIRYKDRMKIPLPTEVIVVIITILASHFGKFEENFDVRVVSNIPVGLPAPRVPDTSILGSIIGDGFAIAVVGFAISVSLSKMYGIKHGYSIDANQELIAYGVSNLIPSFFLCFPNAAALARCEIQDNTGGKTQVVGIISVIIVLIVVLFLGPIFEPLPRTVLGCIIIVGLFGILAQFRNLKTLFHASKVDFVVWVVTVTAVIVLGVDIGLLVGVVFSIITVILRTQFPTCEAIVNIPGTDIYRPKGSLKQEDSMGDVVILKLYSSLYYANKDFFKKKLFTSVGFDPADIINNMKREKEREEQMKKEGRFQDSSCLSLRKRNRRDEQVESTQNQNGSIPVQLESEEQTGVPEKWKQHVHTVIIDCGSFGFIDVVGAKALKQLCKQFNEIGVSFFLANCSRDIREGLKRNGYFEVSGHESNFISVHDAALYALHRGK